MMNMTNIMNKFKKRTFAWMVLSIGLLLATGAEAVAPPNNAWACGEKLNYTVKFGPFTAGTTMFSIDEETTFGGKRVYKFRTVMTSSPRFFYKINDSATSYSEKNSLYSLRYDKVQRESDENSANVTLFNHDAGTAQR